MKKETGSSYYQSRQQQQQLGGVVASDDDDDDDDDYKTEEEEMGSSSSSTTSNSNGDAGVLKTVKEQKQQQKQQQQQQQHWRQRRFTIFGAVVVVLLVGGVLGALILGRTSICTTFTGGGGGCAKKQKTPSQQEEEQQQQQGSSSSSSWISLKLPVDLNVQSEYGALAMNTDGSLLAIGDPLRTITFGATSDDEPYRGRVILLQQQQQQAAAEEDNVEGGEDIARRPFYRTVQILEANDGWSEFGTALALSSSSTTINSTLVVGVPHNIGNSLRTKPKVQVYVRQTTAAADGNTDAAEEEHYWEMVDEFPNLSNNDETGSWVAVSDDGSRVLYSAPNYQPDDPGDIGFVDKPDDDAATKAAGRGTDGDDDWYNPATGAVLLWHHGKQEAFLRGECANEYFGRSVSMSSSSSGDDAAGAPPVVVITRSGCLTSKERQRTVTVWEGHDNVVTNLVLRDPNEDCVMDGADAVTKVSKNGKRIVVLASCTDQETDQIKLAIYTFEKDESRQAWVERVPSNDKNINIDAPTIIFIDSILAPHRMSSFAFDDDAKTVVLTHGGGVRFNYDFYGHGTDLLCYKWNETTVSWQESWRKAAKDSDFGIAIAVALSGNGKRLAIIGSSDEAIPHLAVYNLP
jgi:hypothetical protein